ncbi:MAG: ABC transporter permease [Anaerolineae bacterium]
MLRTAAATIRRDILTQASYRLSFLTSIVSILFTVTLFFFISRVLGTVAAPIMEGQGGDYFGFVLTGIAFWGLISVNGLSSVVLSYQQSGVLEVFFLSPTPVLANIVMSTLWGHVWSLLQAGVYLLVGTLVFGAQLEWAKGPQVLVVVLALLLANGGLALANAAFSLVTKRNGPLSGILAMATTILSGVYYPVEVLPGALRGLSRLLPASHFYKALRMTMLENASLGEILPQLGAMGLFTAVLLPLGLLAFRYAVHRAKIEGSLSQF